MKRTPPNCPKCGSTSIASIAYGLVDLDEQLQQRIDAGEIVLGGCVIEPDSKSWRCNDCRHRFSGSKSPLWPLHGNGQPPPE